MDEPKLDKPKVVKVKEDFVEEPKPKHTFKIRDELEVKGYWFKVKKVDYKTLTLRIIPGPTKRG